MRLSKKIGIEVAILGACLLLGASMPAGTPIPRINNRLRPITPRTIGTKLRRLPTSRR